MNCSYVVVVYGLIICISGGVCEKEAIVSLPNMAVMKQIVQKIKLNCNRHDGIRNCCSI